MHYAIDIFLTHWGRDQMAVILQTTFQMHLLERKFLNFDLIFKVCTQGSIKQYADIGSDKYLASNCGQAIIWTHLGYQCTYACLTRPEWVNLSLCFEWSKKGHINVSIELIIPRYLQIISLGGQIRAFHELDIKDQVHFLIWHESIFLCVKRCIIAAVCTSILLSTHFVSILVGP